MPSTCVEERDVGVTIVGKPKYIPTVVHVNDNSIRDVTTVIKC